MCATTCSFCKKSASKLVPHYLCDCCLVHLECCEATLDNNWSSYKNTIILDDDINEKVDCEICLEKFPENELEDHQEMCMARLVFRCSVCEGDYLSKESLWNHLDQHDIADEAKELNYTEVRTTYKLYKCVLCNDHRGYQESIYWRHVHEDHDGFFLRCMDCGKNFRSEKLKTDHALNHCNIREQTNASSSTALELNQQLTVLPELELLQNKQSGHQISLIPKEKTKIFEPNSDFHSKIGDSANRDAQIVEGSNEVHNGGKELTDEAKKSLPNLESPATVSNEKSCTHCDKAFNDEIALTRHIECFHNLFTCNICGISVDNRNQIRYHKVVNHTEPNFKCTHCPKVFHFKFLYKRHLAMHEIENKDTSVSRNKTKHVQKHMLQVNQPKSQAIIGIGTDCNEEDRTKHTEHLDDNIPTQQDISGEDSSFHQEARGDCSASSDNSNERSGETFSDNMHTKAGHDFDLPVEVSEMESKDGNTRMESQAKIPSETTTLLTSCPLCGVNFDDEHLLSKHVATIHQMTVCTFCGMTFASTHLLKYHKQKHHSIAKYNCNQCHQSFNRQSNFFKHVNIHEKEMKNHCTICSLQFKDASTRRSHMESKHYVVSKPLIPKCACSICGVTITNRLRLRYHMLKYHTEPKFRCSHCPRKFIREGNYLNHLHSHKSLRMIPCNFCNLKFERIQNLKAHIKSRHGSESPNNRQIRQDNSQTQVCEEELPTECEEVHIKDNILDD